MKISAVVDNLTNLMSPGWSEREITLYEVEFDDWLFPNAEIQ